jgi:competence protein ComEC
MLSILNKKIIFVILSVLLSHSCFGKNSPGGLSWTMINVNYAPQQGDAHLIQTDTGKNILIDTGFFKQAEDMLIPFLISKKVKVIDKVFISHPHQDHYAGLLMLLKKGIRIKEAYFNLPDKGVCDYEIPWGCNYKELLEYRDFLTKSDVMVLSAKSGDKFEIGTAASLEILYAYDGINTPVGRTDINDMSLIMKLTEGTQTALFTGDLNARIGEYLAKEGNNLKADILKLPHHGTEGAAPDSFFEAVSPKVAMVPSPALLWCSARSARMKKWVESKKIPTYVNGFAGHVIVKMRKDSFQVTTQRSKALPYMVKIAKCP